MSDQWGNKPVFSYKLRKENYQRRSYICFFGFVFFIEAEIMIVFAAIIEKSNSKQSFVQIQAIRLVTYSKS